MLIRFHRRGHLRTVMPRTGYVECPRGHSRYLPCRVIPTNDERSMCHNYIPLRFGNEEREALHPEGEGSYDLR